MVHIFIIQREQPELFRYMRAHFADDPDVTVLLDRRAGNRRLGERRRHAVLRGPDRRTGDRRAPHLGSRSATRSRSPWSSPRVAARSRHPTQRENSHLPR